MLDAYKSFKKLQELEALVDQDPVQAHAELDSVLQKDPNNQHVLVAMAKIELMRGLTEAAAARYQQILSHNPDHLDALINLADLYRQGAQVRSAIPLYQRATQLAPERDRLWANLSDCLEKDQNPSASQQALAQYQMISAFNAELNQAQQAYDRDQLQQADQMCRHLLQKVPNETRVLCLLAKIATRFKQNEASVSILGHCVTQKPNDIQIGLAHAHALLSCKRFQATLDECQRLLALSPETLALYDLKAGALVALGRYHEAIDIYQELLTVHPLAAQCHLRLGNVEKTLGNTADAIKNFQHAIQLCPELGESYWNLANLKTYQFTGKEIAAMQKIANDARLPPISRIQIEFALGKALEDAEQFAQSFDYYHKANEGYKALSRCQYKSNINPTKQFFSRDYFEQVKIKGHASSAPIFIVGLPRSGSTLVEQILSCHSQIDSTMELTEIISIARQLNQANPQGPGQYPSCLSYLSTQQLTSLAQRYLDFAAPLRQGAPYFIDKLPNNFNHIGLIKSLFPHAKIIDVRRNPMASGWSLYKHFFAEGHDYAYDLKSIGQYYNDYIELMNHWHQVLPNQILTLHYEDIVNDLEQQVSDLLRFIGVEFESDCLNYHLNKRAVATISAEQVRQPLYTNALNHWQNFAQFMQPLAETINR